MNLFKKKFALLTAVLFISMGSSLAWAQGHTSPFIIEIKMKKPVFSIGERPEGEVMITNTKIAALSGVFDIRYYLKGELFFKNFTSVSRIFPGPNRYSFKDFGIVDINEDLNATGEWRIEIIHRATNRKGSASYRVVEKE